MKHVFTSDLHRKTLRELESLRSQATKEVASAERREKTPMAQPAGGTKEKAGEEPVGEFEQVLAKSWAEALGLKRVSRQDNFFHLGGHSLAALKIAFKCRQEFQMEFPLQMFVQYPVLSEQAKRVEEMILEQADAGELQSMIAEFTKNK